LNEVAYQANDVQKYVHGSPYRGVPALLSNANFKAVGVEMCLDKKGNITAATFNRSVDVAVELCKKFKLSANDIVRHYDVTEKNCPAPWVKNPSEFTRFKNAVAAKLKVPAPLHGLHWRWARKGLFIRSDARWDSKVVFKIPNYYAAQINYDVEKNGFYQVVFQGKKGWYKPSTTLYWFEKNPTVKYVVTGDIVNFRSSYKWGSKVVQTKKKGDTVLVLRKMKNGWLQVILTDGIIGYIPDAPHYIKKAV
ncbi:N-acetylmuramoyl-L-alanine amidase, partial [Listeria fleischmannii]|uniref:N-acetylmuramoyl-L-alanine amidase n=1 Tax=Listeria fleischmannii TaxID=1069827 RepID=UPI002892AB43